jgi:hypothetical protein
LTGIDLSRPWKTCLRLSRRRLQPWLILAHLPADMQARVLASFEVAKKAKAK